MQEILITSSVLILALLVLRLVFGKKVRRRLIYGAWALVALRLLVPVQIGQLDFSILTSAKPMTEAITEVSNKQVAGVTEQDAYREIIKNYVEKDQTVFTPEVQEHIQSAIRDEMPKEEIAVMIDKVYDEKEVFVPEVQQQVQQQVEETAEPITLGQIATVVWLAGVTVMAIWFAIVNLRHSHMLRQGRKELHCKSVLPVYVSEKVGSPCLVGLFHPAVYLTPESAASEETLRHVLTHELTHYAHKDHIWSLVRCVCLCVYWFDPLVWVAAWFSRRDCELACDEGALERLGEEERIAYGKTLLDVVSHAAAHAHLLQTATAMNETKKQLKERVNFILKKPKLSIIAAICMVLVCAIVTGCVAAGPMGEPSAVDEARIKEDAVKRFSTPSDTCKPEEVKLTIISQFGDTYALFVDMPFWMYTQALWTDTVNGLKFNYSNGQRMYIYADGEFYTFRVAFDEKIITANQLKTIWEDYYEKYPNRKNMFEEPTLGTTQPTAPRPVLTEPPMDCALPEAVRQQISQAMHAQQDTYVYWKSGARYYGTYDDYVVFFAPGTWVGQSNTHIGPYEFVFQPGGSLWVYKEGAVESLYDVYREQKINDEQLAQIFSAYESKQGADFNTQTFGEDVLQPYLRPLAQEDVARVNAMSKDRFGYSWNWDGICGYYGTYGDLVVVFERGSFFAESGIQVADYYFTYGTSFQIYVFSQDEVFDLRQAYENGMLTYEQLCLIYTCHVLN